MENSVLLKKTARGDKDRIRLIVGGIGDELFSLYKNLNDLGEVPVDQAERETYLLKQSAIFTKTINKIITAHHDLDYLCTPKQAGGKPKNKHWNDAFFLLHEQYKSTGKILTAPKLSAAVTQKFYTQKNQHPDLDGNDPLPERIASEIIRLYKEIFKEELRPT